MTIHKRMFFLTSMRYSDGFFPTKPKIKKTLRENQSGKSCLLVLSFNKEKDIPGKSTSGNLACSVFHFIYITLAAEETPQKQQRQR